MDIKSGLKTWLKNTDGESMNDSRLPDSYDKLVATDRLRRGEHNVRNARPSDQLIQSIERSGIATHSSLDRHRMTTICCMSLMAGSDIRQPSNSAGRSCR
jgi:hypothetical protein